MARAEYDFTRVISDSDYDEPGSPPTLQTRRPISPPTLTRQSSTVEPHEPQTLRSSTPQGIGHGLSQRPATHDSKGNIPYRPSGTSKGAHEEPISPASHQTAIQREPRNLTPKKTEVTLAGLEAFLREFAHEIDTDHANLTARLIYTSWKRDAPRQQFVSKKDWFSGVKLQPVDPNNKSIDAMRIKTKVVFFLFL